MAAPTEAAVMSTSEDQGDCLGMEQLPQAPTQPNLVCSQTLNSSPHLALSSCTELAHTMPEMAEARYVDLTAPNKPDPFVYVKIPFSVYTKILKHMEYMKMKDPKQNVVKGGWTKEEDDKLLELVHLMGAKGWNQVAQHLPGRLGKQCRERYINHLDPNVCKDKWTQEEDACILSAYRHYGAQWAKIAKLLPRTRTANATKNHWNSSLKKVYAETYGDDKPDFLNKFLGSNGAWGAYRWGLQGNSLQGNMANGMDFSGFGPGAGKSGFNNIPQSGGLENTSPNISNMSLLLDSITQQAPNSGPLSDTTVGDGQLPGFPSSTSIAAQGLSTGIWGHTQPAYSEALANLSTTTTDMAFPGSYPPLAVSAATSTAIPTFNVGHSIAPAAVSVPGLLEGGSLDAPLDSPAAHDGDASTGPTPPGPLGPGALPAWARLAPMMDVHPGCLPKYSVPSRMPGGAPDQSGDLLQAALSGNRTGEPIRLPVCEGPREEDMGTAHEFAGGELPLAKRQCMANTRPRVAQR